MTIKCGDIGRDKITGFEGVVTAYSTSMNNCDRVGLQSRELKDGMPTERQWFDIPCIDLVEPNAVPATALVTHSFKEGDEVKDTLSSFKGKVVGFVEWIDGCVRASIQSPELKDGHPVDTFWLPVQQLELVAPAVKEVPKVRTGGPMQSPRKMQTPK